MKSNQLHQFIRSQNINQLKNFESEITWHDALLPLNRKSTKVLDYLLSLDKIHTQIDSILYMGVLTSVNQEMQIYLVNNGASPTRLEKKMLEKLNKGLDDGFNYIKEYELSLITRKTLKNKLENSLESKINEIKVKI